jgi:NitT/TauT family transport system ATP-binding protein
VPKLEHISKSFGANRVFADFSFEFPDDKITAVLGPSGCGKTTLLNLLAGLIAADQGALPRTPHISYLFQEPRLLPWLTVHENIALVLREKIKASEIEKKADRHLQLMGLRECAAHYPAQISGGMRQRVAMARAFAYAAPLLLMDEPFKSLDIKLRFRLIQDFLVLWQAEPRTVLLVTHEVKEALWLADKVVVLSDKPARVLHTADLPSPRPGRDRDPALAEMEKQWVDLLLK